ncbi:UrcA family protein [Sphingomonas cavernae]|uniref:UrcA family protein n=1 Tax=Sphingomonas cavernae TaxID=2320861 RepID=A0A418WPV9_9SPHN|nr:UrcA family protein [Sphingomonas cavernae]RJF93256.1 UrcA family protein [Sphingomonas cavernae]
MKGSTIFTLGAAVLAASIMLPSAPPAFAGQAEAPIVSTAKSMPGDGVRTMAVSYADLNLRSDDGVNRLSGRVHRAAQFVCDLGTRVEPVEQRQDGRNCYDGAMNRANRDIAIAVAAARSSDQLAGMGPPKAIRISSR